MKDLKTRSVNVRYHVQGRYLENEEWFELNVHENEKKIPTNERLYLKDLIAISKRPGFKGKNPKPEVRTLVVVTTVETTRTSALYKGIEE